jgi:hypothetical protein
MRDYTPALSSPSNPEGPGLTVGADVSIVLELAAKAVQAQINGDGTRAEDQREDPDLRNAMFVSVQACAPPLAAPTETETELCTGFGVEGVRLELTEFCTLK